MVDLTPIRHLYPFASHWLDLDGLRYHYLDEGPRDAPVLMLIHGNPTWSFYYRTLIPDLSRHYRVIVPDHIGCGLSDKPQHYPYTLVQHSQNLTRLINYLNLDQISFALHDWGGAIGMAYATQNPDKMARFIIFNTAAFFIPRLPKHIALCRLPGIGEILVRGLNSFCEGAFLFATSQRGRFTASVKAGYLAPYRTWANRIAIHRFIKDIPMQAQHPTRAVIMDIDARLSELRQHPMLIIWGADDFCFTKHDFLPAWQTRFPKADVHVLPKAGHYVVEDASEQIIPLVQNFLQNHPIN